MPMKINRQYEIKGFETIDGKELLHVVGSVETMDRDGDVLILSGGNLKEYQKNPLVFWMHKSQELPIGKAPIVELRGRELHFWIEFKTGKEHIDEIKEYIEEGFINAVSIGFIIHDAKRRTPTPEEREKGFTQVREITKWELLEISIVTIQSNYGGLIKAFGLEEEDHYIEMKNEIKELTKKMETIMSKENTQEVEEKAGRVLSKKREALIRSALDNLTKALDGLGTEEDTEEPTKTLTIEDVETAISNGMQKFLETSEVEPEAKVISMDEYLENKLNKEA